MTCALSKIALFVDALATSDVSCERMFPAKHEQVCSGNLTQFAAFQGDVFSDESSRALSAIDLANVVLADSRPMTEWEQQVTEDIFWSQFV